MEAAAAGKNWDRRLPAGLLQAPRGNPVHVFFPRQDPKTPSSSTAIFGSWGLGVGPVWRWPNMAHAKPRRREEGVARPWSLRLRSKKRPQPPVSGHRNTRGKHLPAIGRSGKKRWHQALVVRSVYLQFTFGSGTYAAVAWSLYGIPARMKPGLSGPTLRSFGRTDPEYTSIPVFLPSSSNHAQNNPISFVRSRSS